MSFSTTSPPEITTSLKIAASLFSISRCSIVSLRLKSNLVRWEMFHKATEACFPMIFTHTKENLAPKGGRNNIFTFFPSPEWVFEIYFGFRVERREPSNPKCGLLVRATNRRVPLFWYSGLLTLIFVSYVIRIRKHLTPTHKYQAIYIYIEFHYGKSPSRFPLFLGARASIHHACTCDVWKSLTPHRPSVPIRILIPILIPPPAPPLFLPFPGCLSLSGGRWH